MYSRFKEEGINDPGQFDWSFAEEFFEQRKYTEVSCSDSGAWRGWSDELDSVGIESRFRSRSETLDASDIAFRLRPIQNFTIPQRTYPTFFAFSGYRPLRYTNISLVAGES